MSIHVCKCIHNGREEYHLRYPGMTQEAAQELADRINAEALAEQPAQHRHISYVCPQCYWSLEERPAQQQEPVDNEKAMSDLLGTDVQTYRRFKQWDKTQQQEPVAWKDRTYGNLHHQDFGNSIPLYTSPQSKPLPKGEWPKHPSAYVNDEYIGYSTSDLDNYATQVLAAHGITGE